MIWNRFLNLDRKSLVVLIDPDKFFDEVSWKNKLHFLNLSSPDAIFLGGSQLDVDHSDDIISLLKPALSAPIISFPGDFGHVHPAVDGLLFLSLLSGRNPEFLIEQHVRHARNIKEMNIQVLPTAYLLINGGKQSAVSRVSGTEPLDYNNIPKIIDTAIAAEMLGKKAVYLEAGSGALFPVTTQVISEVKRNITIPLLVGGGITSSSLAEQALKAGADTIVIGNGFEEDPALILEIRKCVNRFN